ncbi:hypothetical protein ES703_90474 [subsurface metagenome]
MEEKEVTLRDYIKLVKKRKKIILLVLSMGVAATAVISFLLPPVYRVTATIKIGEIVDLNTFEKDPIESAIAASERLEGAQILSDTIEDLKLPFTLKEFRKKVSVEPVRDTEDLIQIRVETNDSGQTLDIANYLANKLLERHKQIKRLHENKEEMLARYGEHIEKIQMQLSEIRSDTTGLEKRVENLEVLAENISRKVEGEIEKSKSLSEAESHILVGQMEDITARLETYRAAIQNRQQRYDLLMRELREAELEKTQLQMRGSLEMYGTEPLVPAKEPKEPVRPNKLLNILVAAVVSLVVALGLVFSLGSLEEAK